ncbi:FAD-binding oxidoreductase [Actinoplanes sp. NPDC089786]|uniref:FAD-binding oxidoreductase n=1 Tax=Actinoplanes sp. NPDC089786 TaxID=3155185 RepID=UPI00341589D8
MNLSRRTVLAATGALAAGIPPAKLRTTPPAVAIRPGDRRYENLLRGNNFRFAGRPDEIRVATNADQVVGAVSDAVRGDKRIAVRSGGHCFENLTAGPDVRMLLDLGPMNGVGYDERRRAFFVEPGATLGEVYRALFKGWGVTVPGGGCPGVGAGGHIVGGGYGPLSRRYGSVVDHLHGVEVVVADRDGRARRVVATREPDDPNRDLWWAHTGGGGGNFGVVTRYWLRSENMESELPPSPQNMLQHVLFWSWEQLTETSFTGLLRNFGAWHERHSAPGSAYQGVYGILQPSHRSGGTVMLVVQADADLPGIAGRMSEFIVAVTAGTGLTPVFEQRDTLSWLHRMTWPGSGEAGDVVTRRYKIKAGYLTRGYTEAQLATIYRHLTNDSGGPQAGMLLIGYGGQVGAVRAPATAIAQRDAVMKVVYQTVWANEADDAASLAWVREFYRDVYATSGGVPPDGSYINYADADLADPAWNTSGIPAQRLYHGDNYPRLRRIKATWDPRGVFRHALSIE